MKPITYFWVMVFLLPAGVCFGPGSAAAHPHVFIAQHTRIVFDEKGLAGFRIFWAFDEMFSAMIAQDFDGDGNGVLDKKEVAVIREKAFGYIARDNYYLHVNIEGKPFAVKYVKDFNAVLENGTLRYEFFVPCHVSAAAKPKTVKLSPYDPNYYSAIYFPDHRPLTFENKEKYDVNAKVKRDMSTLIFYETVNPLAVFMDFRVKS